MTAALVAGAVSLFTVIATGLRDSKRRRQELFAEAFAAYTAYKEFPYVVRRRRFDDPAGERVRISEQLKACQERINFFLAWTALTEPKVGTQYASLVGDMRAIVGPEITKAWQRPAIRMDADVPVGDLLDFSPLAGPEARFLATLTFHFQWPHVRLWNRLFHPN